MSTKVRATILSVDSIGSGASTITLSLESPYYTVLQTNDDVFLELQTLQGNRVEFHLLEHEVHSLDPIPQESPIADPYESVKSETTIPIETKSDDVTSTDLGKEEPVKETKSSKKK